MIQCPHCSLSEQQTKSGHTRTGSQRHRCKECQRIYTPEPKPLGYPEETRREAVRLYLEGTNFRRIGRVLGVNHQSVVNWVNSYHAGLPAAEQSPAAPETLEMDELFTFIGSKKRKPTSSPSSIAPRAASWRGRSVPSARRS
ncbi:MAG TPA: IS1 family transposase [Pyrinomonadaceae bacterium]|nr:IS1 family transposase [Pyrinomonadaceae bacterium]